MTERTEVVLSARGIIKKFGRTTALDGLDLEVHRGEVHGFLGPNGSGKSTTIRAVLGLMHLNGGELSVFGMNPWKDAVEVHRRLAYVPGDVSLWPNLSGGEIIDMLIRMRGADPGAPGSRRAEMIERFGFDPTKKGRAYSKGNRQKVALIAALSAPCELLLLDEPTSGLDPLMEQVFNDCIAEHVASGSTVLLSSHILSEVERLADRVTIIREGRTVESGVLDEMRHLHRSRVTATFSGTAPDLSQIDGVHDFSIDGQTLNCGVEPHALAQVLRILGDSGVTALTSSPPSLEQLFLNVYRTDASTDTSHADTSRTDADADISDGDISDGAS